MVIQSRRQEGPLMFADQSILCILASVLLLPACLPLKESPWAHELEDAVATTKMLSRLQVSDFQ